MANRKGPLVGVAAVAIATPAAWGLVSASGDAGAHTFADVPAYRAVGGFLVGSPFTFGSGVLISPNYVLTAYHDVAGVAPSDLQFSFSLGGPLATAQAVQIIQDTADPAADLAVVQVNFTTSGPAITPATVLQANTSLIGLQGTGIGYGLSGTATGGVDNSTALIGRGGTNVLDLYGHFVATGNTSTFSGTIDPAASPTVNNQIGYDFDSNHTDSSGNPTDNSLGPPPRSSPTPDANEFALAFGDSGGALFATVNGQQVLVGVGENVTDGSNGTLSSYGSISTDTRLYPYLSFVDRYTPEPAAAGVMLLLTSSGLLARRRRST